MFLFIVLVVSLFLLLKRCKAAGTTMRRDLPSDPPPSYPGTLSNNLTAYHLQIGRWSECCRESDGVWRLKNLLHCENDVIQLSSVMTWRTIEGTLWNYIKIAFPSLLQAFRKMQFMRALQIEYSIRGHQELETFDLVLPNDRAFFAFLGREDIVVAKLYLDFAPISPRKPRTEGGDAEETATSDPENLSRILEKRLEMHDEDRMYGADSPCEKSTLRRSMQ